MAMTFDELGKSIKNDKEDKERKDAKEDAEYVVKMCKGKRNFYLEEPFIINGRAKSVKTRVTKRAYIEALLEERGYARDQKILESWR